MPSGQTAPRSVFFVQTVKWMPRQQITPSETSGLARATGWVFGR